VLTHRYWPLFDLRLAIADLPLSGLVSA